ncbi:hypothetical protein ASPACDRAFT_40559 [Aspergillus aculeatus ATCC 16872]|uniref:Uncharacterized protein n=1 Tax=Aspergillus aculeatus (strain ATCC 16872 / CBS 172.66 / WB 5094) TaxID=690307 RepID=A0A1L9X463_ASPA1|nr:uncharacterized protein ASPACDRAFT_40559 [Aspergillus aculeatus ATCC 16872]OJK03236.1 hypothetical protein ASPACDRAFT_40559 [Aspergillus aculeatus ATCC 16872]
MRPVATPFRVSSRSSGGPQFASTPRFFVSQRTPASQQATQDAFSTEDDGPQSTPVPTARFLRRDRGVISTPRQKEIIEDSDDAKDDQQDDTPHIRSGEIIFDDGQTQSSSPVPPVDEDSEFEDLFATIRERKKRRRISVNDDAPSSQPVATRSDTDQIVSSSQDHPASPTPQSQSPTPGAPKQSSMQTQATPAPSHRTPAATATPRPTAPASINPPSTTNPRRFLFPTSHLPPSTQPQSSSKAWVSASTQEPPPSSQRRKPPAFVLPRSPSPSHMDDELAALPTPFSPSSRALRRRGRARGPAHAYLPDGMAAEVRSWVLETGTRHDQQRQTGVARRTGADTSGREPRYSLTMVRIENVHLSALPSCGPLAFVCGHETDALGDEAGTERDPRLRKLLLIGAPRSQSETVIQSRRRVTSTMPELRPGNAIGICRGLTWDIDLGESDIGVEMRDNSCENTALQASGKWTVVLEWELVSDVDGQDSA